jgi:hypothetical protein
MTDKQKQLLKDFAYILMQLGIECHNDDDFNDFIGELEIFKKDLHESFHLLIKELEK